MAEVSLRHIKKVYPNSERTSKKGLFGRKKADDGARKASSLRITDEGVLAVPDFNLDIADREFVVFVGPSGCGKSTTLRMVAGLEEITDGELYIDGQLMNDVAPKDRDIAMVFQSYALYPQMTVYQNMAFSLELSKTPKAEIDKKVRTGPHPSMAAASSISRGMDLTKPTNMKMASPAPKPRYTIGMVQGVLSFRTSAVLESVNITIWKGTTMENTHRK